jgi:hypothetical protein
MAMFLWIVSMQRTRRLVPPAIPVVETEVPGVGEAPGYQPGSSRMSAIMYQKMAPLAVGNPSTATKSHSRSTASVTVKRPETRMAVFARSSSSSSGNLPKSDPLYSVEYVASVPFLSLCLPSLCAY